MVTTSEFDTDSAITRLGDGRFAAHAGWARGAPTGRMEIAGWIRLADGREPDVGLLPCVVDGFPPTIFELGAAGWVPTLELTLHVRRRPAAGWLRCAIRSRHVSAGMVEEDAEVWDASDQLVAMSRQVSRLPRGPAGATPQAP